MHFSFSSPLAFCAVSCFNGKKNYASGILIGSVKGAKDSDEDGDENGNKMA